MDNLKEIFADAKQFLGCVPTDVMRTLVRYAWVVREVEKASRTNPELKKLLTDLNDLFLKTSKGHNRTSKGESEGIRRIFLEESVFRDVTLQDLQDLQG